jgi:glycosyltransferase involved in cell wall biosynthesis
VRGLPAVCIFTETYYPVVGGGETQAQALAEHLDANGFNVNVITRHSHASLKKREKSGTVTIHRLPPIGSGHYKKWGLLLTSLPTLIKLRRSYDLVFVSGFRVLGIPAVLVSRLLGKACVLKADSLGEMSGDFFAAGLARFGLRPSSLFFRSFLALRNWILKKACGVNRKKIHLIPNGVDTCRFHPVNPCGKSELRRKLGLSLEEKIVLYTGRLVSYKGLPLLLRVWREIQTRHRDLRLLLLGSGGLDLHNCESELREYVIANDLQDSVQFTGDVRNVHEYLQAADIFVFPTEREAFGISLIEAMACGLPSISTSVGGVKDILDHERNGIVVEAGDHRQLLAALETCITSPALASLLGHAAWKTVRDDYSAEVVTETYVNLFQKLCNQNGHASF